MNSPQIQRRTLARGAAWATPVVLASAAIPAYAASPVPATTDCTYGTIVAAPWSNVWPSQGDFDGRARKELEWAVYPTSNCTGSVQAFSFDNSFPKDQAANPLSPSSAPNNTWPPTFPAGGDRMADINSVNGVNGVGQGTIISVKVENVAGDVVYQDTPTGDDRFLFTAAQGDKAYNPNGTRGLGANVPVIRLNDDFKGADTKYDKLYNYLRFAEAPMVTKNTMWTWGYGNHYTTTEGRDGWSWDIKVMSNIAHGQAGASVVSFMTRLPAATFGDPAKTDPKVIKTQYKVTVASPWGVVTYLSDAI
ncbi:hypothetical protein [Rothia sp. 32237D007AR]